MNVSDLLKLQKEISQDVKSEKEVEAIIEAIEIEQLFSAYQHRAGKTERAQHPKQHGTVHANLSVSVDLPTDFQEGIFKPGNQYQGVVRFSNGNANGYQDDYPGLQGMAIKLKGIEGDNLTEGMNEQDFLLVSYPNFIIPNMIELAEAMKALAGGAATSKAFFSKHPDVYKRSEEQKGYYKNPLEVQFYSATAYQYGDKIVKYSLSPQESPNRGSYKKGDIPANVSADYLQNAMESTLDQKSVLFDFMIQVFRNEKETPVEDPTVIWDSDFIKIGVLEIPQQYFTAEGQLKIGQNLSFNPWHCIPDHKPLGSINLARKFIYKNLYDFRIQRDVIAPNSPGQKALNLELKVRETPVTIKSASGEVVIQTKGIKDNYQTLRAALTGGGTGLDSIKTIHFARNLFFDPVYETDENGFEQVSYYKTVTLMTAYDEGFADYVIDFAESIYERFNLLLSFVQGTEDIQDEDGHVKVQKNVRNFVKFIGKHNRKEVAFYSSYPDLTVVQILQNRESRNKELTGECPMGF